MKKNLIALLQKGNITPKERVLLLVHNWISEERDKKRILSEADEYALAENWKPENNDEVKEYNRYNEGWKNAVFAEMDAQTIYLQTKISNYKKQYIDFNLSFYPLYKELRESINVVSKIKKVDIKEAVEIANKQRAQKLKNGLDFDYAVYQLAFESLPETDQKRFIELYPDIETDHQYLDQEEIIANLFNGKDELTPEAKEKLAELVAGRSYNTYAKEYQLFHYFACIPVAEVARQFLISKGIKVNGELVNKDDKDKPDDYAKALNDYAKANNTTIKAIIKNACLEWLEGDLSNDHTPLIISTDAELFKKWLAIKDKTKATLQKLIDDGKLKTEETKHNPDDHLGLGFKVKKPLKLAGQVLDIKPEECNNANELDYLPTSDKTITGESLYNFQSDYKFVKNFKEDVDTYRPNLGIVYADNDPEHKGEHLDKELLIAKKTNNGELSIFSLFSIYIEKIKNLFDATQIIKETEKNGELYLDFERDELTEIYKNARTGLIEGYAKLLAFNEMYEKLSKVYEADLTYKIKSWLKDTEEKIDLHNKIINTATGQKPLFGDESEDAKETTSWFIKKRGVLKTNDDLFIEKENIKPDTEWIASYYKKFTEILGKEF